VEDGGQIIIYAPHITEISTTHGKYLEKCGYHVRDFFIPQMEEYKEFPLAILAHSTHVKGCGTYVNGVEKPRFNVVLATSIPKEICDKINLGYMDPKTINLQDYKNKEDEGILLIEEAGETLFHLKK
jgi:hypothetical protein